MPNPYRAGVYMIACGRIWESEIIIVTEEDCWRDTLEDAGLLLDLDAAASDLEDGSIEDDHDWIRHGC